MLFAFALAYSLAVRPQESAIPMLTPKPGTVSAIPVCKADHAHCTGRASLYFDTEYGPFVLAECDIRAGERFELSSDGAPISDNLLDSLVVEVRLEGHLAVTADAPPMSAGCDLGRWHIPAIGSRHVASQHLPIEAKPPSTRILRLELEGGDPRDVIVDFTIPDHTTPPGMCGLGYHDIHAGYLGLRRIDTRTWEVDLDHVREMSDHFPIYLTTMSGALLRPKTDWATSKDTLPAVLKFDAPARLCALHGRVVDATGKPIAGANVVGGPLPTPILRTVVSTVDGSFAFDALAPGDGRVFVNDANWRSRNTYGSLFDLSLVDLKSDSQASKRVVVDRQRWIEINPTELKLGEGIGALLCVVNNPKEEWPSGPDSIVALQPQDLAAPFRIPAYWGTSFELSVVAVPPAGCEHDGDLGEWIRMAPFARAIVTFPDVNTPAITQFVALR